MCDKNLKKLAKTLIENKLTISTAESCTGGLLASRLTDISGSSNFLMESHITYANSAKNKYLGVSEEILNTKGAVSKECAQAMAIGLSKLSNSDISLCTTGIAGPTGGTKEKPVGLIYISCHFNNKTTVEKHILPSFLPRKLMKYMFSEKAIELALKTITQQ